MILDMDFWIMDVDIDIVYELLTMGNGILGIFALLNINS